MRWAVLDRRLRALPAALALAAGPVQGEIVDRIVAVVGRDVITLSEAEESRRLRLLRSDEPSPSLVEVVERLIEARLIEREVERYPTEPIPDEEVDRAVEAIERSFPSREAFVDALRESGMSLEELRFVLLRQLRINRHLERRFRPLVYVPDEAVRRYYDEELLPELAASGSPPVPFETVAADIRRLLEEREFNRRVDAWIEDLKARTRIRRYVW